jgi:ubiquinone/menaquinone biosynthesis C-methylase UbiE
MSDSAAYVMGHDDRERRRLMLQASILNPLTEQLLRRAGISPGMEVLDIGCGVGDVSLLAARLVGRHGSVTSVDVDAAALKILEARAAAEVNNIDCVQANIHEWKPGRKFDAVVGRHILIHSKDPLAVLRHCAAVLYERGLAAFHEYDFSVVQRAWPSTPLRDRVMDVFDRFFARAAYSNMGSRLWTLLMEAGFERPDCRTEYPISGGSDSFYYEWITESFRSIQSRAIALGIIAEGEFDLDTLEQRLREEVTAGNSCIPAPAMIGAFARLRTGNASRNQHD